MEILSWIAFFTWDFQAATATDGKCKNSYNLHKIRESTWINDTHRQKMIDKSRAREKFEVEKKNYYIITQCIEYNGNKLNRFTLSHEITSISLDLKSRFITCKPYNNFDHGYALNGRESEREQISIPLRKYLDIQTIWVIWLICVVVLKNVHKMQKTERKLRSSARYSNSSTFENIKSSLNSIE